MKLFLSLILLLTTSLAQAEVMTYKAWKASRIDQARQALDRCQTELAGPRGPGARSPHADAHLQQAKMNLEIAQDLNAHDYFVLYLSQLKNEAEFQEGAKRLTPEEVAQILAAVKKQDHVAGTGMEASVPMLIPAASSTTLSR